MGTRFETVMDYQVSIWKFHFCGLGVGTGFVLFCYGCAFVSEAQKGDYVDVGPVEGGSSQSYGNTFGCSDGIMDGGFCWELGG